MTSLGTLKTEFSRTYIYLNPDPFQGPPVWRLSNIPGLSRSNPDDGLIDGIYTLLPIAKTESGNNVDLYFDIASLPDSRSVSRRPSYIPSVLTNFLSYTDDLPKAYSTGLAGLKGEDPIKTIVQDDIGIVYFDMTDLPSLETVRRKRRFYLSSRTFKYNSRSVDALTATEPLVSQTSAQVATVSIDFSTLPEA